MNQEHFDASISKAGTIEEWQTMLQDNAALLAHPGLHHRTLVKQAHAMHQAQTVSSDDLSDLLELADGALAYAVESLLDLDNGE